MVTCIFNRCDLSRINVELDDLVSFIYPVRSPFRIHTSRISKVHWVVSDIGVQVEAVGVAQGIGGEEAAECGRVVAGAVIGEAGRGIPHLPGEAEGLADVGQRQGGAGAVTAVDFAERTVGEDDGCRAGRIGLRHHRAEMVGAEPEAAGKAAGTVIERASDIAMWI